MTPANPPSRDINGMSFSTFDSDNDKALGVHCAGGDPALLEHAAGWWYNYCALGEPNGPGTYFRWFSNSSTTFKLMTSRMMVKEIDK